MCEAARQVSLSRAIESALSQTSVAVELIVLVNGNRYDPELLDRLRADARLRVVYQEEGSLPAALRHARTLVTGEYFTFVDDDDEYLPNALRIRLEPMLTNLTLDVVATNGYRAAPDDVRYIGNADAINRDPLAAMIDQNWLASCGGLFRSSAIHAEYFDGKTKYFEWTLLAYRILFAGHKVLFLDAPTYRINDSPGSLSKSLEYRRASAGFIEYLLTLHPPRRIAYALKRKLSAAQHDLSSQLLKSGDRKNAWRFHLKSLSGPGAWRYLIYTRRLLLSNRFYRS